MFRRSRKPLVIGCILAVLAVAGLVLFIVLLPESDEPESSDSGTVTYLIHDYNNGKKEFKRVHNPDTDTYAWFADGEFYKESCSNETAPVMKFDYENTMYVGRPGLNPASYDIVYKNTPEESLQLVLGNINDGYTLLRVAVSPTSADVYMEKDGKLLRILVTDGEMIMSDMNTGSIIPVDRYIEEAER